MKVLVFMQNMWVRDPKRTQKSIDHYGEDFRLHCIRQFLFMGCTTGRVLKQCFGEDLIKCMVFEESTREIAGDPKTIFPPDYTHIAAAIKFHRPEVIVAFGKIAGDACYKVLIELMRMPEKFDIKFLRAPHPAARQPDTRLRLRDCAKEIRKSLSA